MDTLLPLIFFFIMGFAVLTYSILDGYDLGIGILLPLGDEAEKDQMIASIGPFWDANETWIVLGVGVLLIAFPEAHGRVLTALYLPVTLMLIGLILRGVAFDLRVKAGLNQKHLWDRAFFAGSLLASVTQGWMVGAYITGLKPGLTNTLFAGLIAVLLPAFYVFLGSAWLMIKTEGVLFDKAVGWAKRAIPPMAGALLLISIATPLVSATIAARWFTLPNAIGLSPIPISCVLVFGALIGFFSRSRQTLYRYAWMPFAGTVVIGLMAAIGLAYSLYPYIVIDELTIWETASATNSLLFVLVGVAVSVPAIIGYSIFVYRTFAGKTGDLEYD
ncbi:MAG: cytochrome d ubiquinol oxidase subunit II [Pseudomonadota bacterium]|nr:cytochrome d ubiquinol oxidase subunit II [Pseudomonadota bacterium]